MRVKTLTCVSGVIATMVSNALAAGLVTVSGGEHDKYSRIVLSAMPSPVDVEYGRRRISLYFDGEKADFALNSFNDRRSAHRVLKASSSTIGDNVRIDFDLTCDCGAKASVGRSGRLILDIAESYPRVASRVEPLAGQSTQLKQPDPAPQAGGAPTNLEPPAIKATPTTSVAVPKTDTVVSGTDELSKARNRMVALLTQAAQDGIVTFKEDATPSQPASGAREEGQDLPKSIVLNQQDALETCRPDSWFFPTRAPNDKRAMEQIERIQTMLVGEFDTANPEAVRKLFWTYASIGFGDEARSVLEAFPIVGPDLNIMVDVAKTISDRPIESNSEDGLGLVSECEGMHGLFQALALASSDPARASAILRTRSALIEALPEALVGPLATRLGLAAADAGEWVLAGEMKRYADLAGRDDPAFQYLLARFEKHKGREDKARARLEMLAENESPQQADALLALAQEYAENGEALPEGFAEDAGIVAATTDDPNVRRRATEIEAKALMSEGEFASAFRQIIRTYRETPQARKGLALAARSLLIEAMGNGDAAAQLSGLDAYVDFEEFIDGSSGNDPALVLHTQAAKTALEFGLPNVASYALARSGATNEEVQKIRQQIKRLDAITSKDVAALKPSPLDVLKSASADTNVDDDPISMAERAAKAAYLAGQSSVDQPVRQLLADAGSDYSMLFERQETRIKTAKDAKKVADQAAVELRVLKEAVSGR
ncbi:MAG: hypothetical protein AAF742_04970 [Pseudomonadota bacterium]